MLVYDGVYEAYQKELKKEAKYATKLTFVKKPVSTYSSKDFVLYFQKKFEEIYEMPYDVINMPAACNVMKGVTTSFYKATHSNEIVLNFIDHELLRGKMNGKLVKLRTLQYGITDFLYKLKTTEKKSVEENKEVLEELAKVEENTWSILKRKWKK